MSDFALDRQLGAYVEYLRDMGVYDLYFRHDPAIRVPDSALRVQKLPERSVVATKSQPVPRQSTEPNIRVGSVIKDQAERSVGFSSPMAKPPSLDDLAPLPTHTIPAANRLAALDLVRDEIGDCTRCPLAYAGRKTIVFGDGDPSARLMFVGEGPGADEDASGIPFVGKAGQLLNNMIAAMGLKREEVYIANIVKCRPPGNRTPEPVEATTCSQFLLKQIDIVRPEVIVALGATAATYLLGVKQSLASLRGQWHSVRGAKVAVTYHPAFLLRDPRQKVEAWKDLQRVMAEMRLVAPKRPS
jgi:DNA polymerase